MLVTQCRTILRGRVPHKQQQRTAAAAAAACGCDVSVFCAVVASFSTLRLSSILQWEIPAGRVHAMCFVHVKKRKQRVEE